MQMLIALDQGDLLSRHVPWHMSSPDGMSYSYTSVTAQPVTMGASVASPANFAPVRMSL